MNRIMPTIIVVLCIVLSITGQGYRHAVIERDVWHKEAARLYNTTNYYEYADDICGRKPPQFNKDPYAICDSAGWRHIDVNEVTKACRTKDVCYNSGYWQGAHEQAAWDSGVTHKYVPCGPASPCTYVK